MAVATSTAIMLALAAAGAAASYQNTKNTAKRTDNALANQIENQASKGREADKRIRESIDKQAGSNPEDAKNKALQQYTAQLHAAGPNATAGLGPMAGASDRFNQEAADASLGVKDYGLEQAGLSARLDAPRTQRDQEGFDRQRANNDLGQIERMARMRDFLDGLKVNKAGQRNAGLDAFAGFASGASSAVGAGGGAGAGTATGVDPVYGGGYTTYNGNGWRNAYGAGG